MTEDFVHEDGLLGICLKKNPRGFYLYTYMICLILTLLRCFVISSSVVPGHQIGLRLKWTWNNVHWASLHVFFTLQLHKLSLPLSHCLSCCVSSPETNNGTAWHFLNSDTVVNNSSFVKRKKKKKLIICRWYTFLFVLSLQKAVRDLSLLQKDCCICGCGCATDNYISTFKSYTRSKDTSGCETGARTTHTRYCTYCTSNNSCPLSIFLETELSDAAPKVIDEPPTLTNKHILWGEIHPWRLFFLPYRNGNPSGNSFPPVLTDGTHPPEGNSPLVPRRGAAWRLVHPLSPLASQRLPARATLWRRAGRRRCCAKGVSTASAVIQHSDFGASEGQDRASVALRFDLQSEDSIVLGSVSAPSTDNC